VTLVPLALLPSPKLQLVSPSADHTSSGMTENDSDCPAVADVGIETSFSSGPAPS
jgi:hypothetical protein